MGAVDSKEAAFQDEITRVLSNRSSGVALHPLIEKLQDLKTVSPILRVASAESNLQDVMMLRRTPSNSSMESDSVRLDAKTTMEMFAIFEEWCKDNAAKATRNQEEIHSKIDLVEALAVKLVQRLNHSVGVMKASAEHLQDVRTLQAEIVEMKGELNSVVESFEVLCNRLEREGYLHPPPPSREDSFGEDDEPVVTVVFP